MGLTGLLSRCYNDCVLAGESVSLPVALPGTTRTPGLMASFLHLQGHQAVLVVLIAAPLPLFSSSRSHSYRSGYIEFTWVIQGISLFSGQLISNPHSPLPCSITYLLVIYMLGHHWGDDSVLKHDNGLAVFY